MKKVDLLPAFAHLVTNYSTVYSVLRNFEYLRKQLSQQSFPAISDESVYR